jgi:Flp pilus assembly protein TadG
MKITSTFQALSRRSDAAVGAEFALVLPLLILLLLGMIDVGRYMWTLNEVEKATQMGARMAVVTTMVPGGLATQNYATTLGQGATIPISSFGAAQCSSPGGTLSCTCLTAPCPTLTPVDNTAFGLVTTRMSQIARVVAPSNVQITYTNSGLGYAGDPTGSDVAPIVTVSAVNVGFNSLIGQFFGISLRLPTVSASLTLEDGQGNFSN